MNVGDICSFTFYFLLNVMTYGILYMLNDNFYSSYGFFFHFFFIIFAIISYVLLITVKNKPGRLYSDDYSVMPPNNNTNEESSERISIPSSVEASQSSFFQQSCDKCNLAETPFRSKHCSRCGYCLRKFDHHCALIGGCVGEDNHFKFLIFLLTQTITLLIGIYGILTTVSMILSNNKEQYFHVPFALYFLAIILGGYCLFTTVLFFYHIYLIGTNQTTYEIFNKDKARYVAQFIMMKQVIFRERNIELPKSFIHHPFDMGIKENIKCLFKRTDWARVYKENLFTNKIPFNIFENEYWSCF